MSRLDSSISAKKEKLAELQALEIEVYPYQYDKKDTLQACLEKKDQLVQTAGRVMSWRTHGKVIFADLADQTATMQVMLHADRLSAAEWQMLALVDPGDFLGVTGKVDVTKTGQLTIMVEKCVFLGKSLRPLPSTWNAAEDKETRFRQRYLDMLVNPQAKKILDARWQILAELRAYLTAQGFTEVETPVMQPLYGGTSAKPFTTHMNALDCDFYLRIAPELYLKRLIVGGMEKIFEIARNFRNEGVDQTHQPEFTMVEWYEAYADYHRNMELIEGLINHLNQKINHSSSLMIGETEIDLSQKWPCYTINQALHKFLEIDVDQLSDQELFALLDQHHLEILGEFNRGKAIFALFDKLVCHQLIQPTWIIDYPKDVSPLAKVHRSNSELTERYELYIGGQELSDGWSEITDPQDQRSRFDNEQRKMRDGDQEAQPTDEDFLAAMEYGMPPLAGVGLGIDRLVMLLTNTTSIKEVIAFPTLKPLHSATNVAFPVDQLEGDDQVIKPNSGDDKVAFQEPKNDA